MARNYRQVWFAPASIDGVDVTSTNSASNDLNIDIFWAKGLWLEFNLLNSVPLVGVSYGIAFESFRVTHFRAVDFV